MLSNKITNPFALTLHSAPVTCKSSDGFIYLRTILRLELQQQLTISFHKFEKKRKI